MNISQPSDSPVVALLREQFRRTGHPVIGVLVIALVMIWGMALFVRATQGGGIDGEASGMIGVFTWCLVSAILLWGYSSPTNLRAQIPVYALRLPLKTSVLVFWRVLYNLIAMTIVCGVLTVSASMASYNPDREEFMTLLEWDWVWGGLLFFLFIQTTCWFVSNYKTLFIGIPVLWVLLNRVGKLFGSYLDDSFLIIEYLPLIALLVALPIAYVLSVIGVHARRHGLAPLSSVLAVSLGNRVRARAAGPNKFESPQEAQRWFESRRIGRILPLSTLCLAGLGILIALSDVTHRDYNHVESIIALGEKTLYVVLGSVLFVPFMAGGIFFALNCRAQTPPNSGFFFIRPMASKDLAAARLFAAAKSLPIITGFVLVATFVTYAATLLAHVSSIGNQLIGHSPFASEPELHAFAIFGTLLVLAIMVYIWGAMWIGNTIIAVIVFYCVMYSIAAFDPTLVNLVFLDDNDFPLLLTPTFCILGIIVVCLFGNAFRNRLLGKTTLKAAFLVLCASVGVTLLFSANGATLRECAGLLPFFALAVAPLATVPLTMHWARHR